MVSIKKKNEKKLSKSNSTISSLSSLLPYIQFSSFVVSMDDFNESDFHCQDRHQENANRSYCCRPYGTCYKYKEKQKYLCYSSYIKDRHTVNALCCCDFYPCLNNNGSYMSRTTFIVALVFILISISMIILGATLMHDNKAEKNTCDDYCDTLSSLRADLFCITCASCNSNGTDPGPIFCNTQYCDVNSCQVYNETLCNQRWCPIKLQEQKYRLMCETCGAPLYDHGYNILISFTIVLVVAIISLCHSLGCNLY